VKGSWLGGPEDERTVCVATQTPWRRRGDDVQYVSAHTSITEHDINRRILYTPFQPVAEKRHRVVSEYVNRFLKFAAELLVETRDVLTCLGIIATGVI